MKTPYKPYSLDEHKHLTNLKEYLMICNKSDELFDDIEIRDPNGKYILLYDRATKQITMDLEILLKHTPDIPYRMIVGMLSNYLNIPIQEIQTLKVKSRSGREYSTYIYRSYYKSK